MNPQLRMGVVGGLCVLAMVLGARQAAAQESAPASRPAVNEAELRQRIIAEIKEEMRRESEEQRKAKEMEEMKQMIRGLRDELSEAKRQRAEDTTPRVDSNVTRAGNDNYTPTTYSQPVNTGPVRGMRYAIPPQHANTAAGYVVNYAGYNYIINNDGTMTFYEGTIYYPNTATNNVTYTNPTNNVRYVNTPTLYYTQPINNAGYNYIMPHNYNVHPYNYDQHHTTWNPWGNWNNWNTGEHHDHIINHNGHRDVIHHDD